MRRSRAKNKKGVFIPTKFGKFLCLFEPNDPDRGFTATSPAAPGFVAYGRTLQETKRTAREALEFHCECMLFEGPSIQRRALQQIER